MNPNVDVNRNDDSTSATPPVQFFGGYFETDYDLWKDYFDVAYNNLTSSATTAEWNEIRIVEKAASLADYAFKRVILQRDSM